jgi:zinc protease
MIRALLTAACLAVLASGTAEAIRLPPTREVKLPNGALLILAEKHDVPLISLRVSLRGGSIADPTGKEGVASITAELLRKGAGKRTAQEIAATVDGLGAWLDTGSGLEVSYVAAGFMSRDQAVMLDLVADVLRRPTFPEQEFEKLRSQTVDEITSAKDDPSNVIGDYVDAFFYASHPYARPTDGDEATNKGLTRADVLRYYEENYGGDRLIISVVGDFSSATMESKIRAKLGDWAKATKPAPTAPPPERFAGRRVLLVDKPDATQSYFWIGNLGVPRSDPDRVPLSVVTTAYGGRFTSILNTALRIEGGLTYGARVSGPRYLQAGTIGLSSYTKTESTEKAVDMALQTLETLRSRGIPDTTLTSAKTYMIGQFPPTLETGGAIAGAYADLAFYGQTRDEFLKYADRVTAVTPEVAKGVITRVYPPVSDLTFVFVGNAAAIRKVVSKYGPVTEIPITEPLLSKLRK